MTNKSYNPENDLSKVRFAGIGGIFLFFVNGFSVVLSLHKENVPYIEILTSLVDPIIYLILGICLLIWRSRFAAVGIFLLFLAGKALLVFPFLSILLTNIQPKEQQVIASFLAKQLIWTLAFGQLFFFGITASFALHRESTPIKTQSGKQSVFRS